MMALKVCCIKINHFEDFQYPLNNLSKGWLFRGHEDAAWTLQSSLERVIFKRNEQIANWKNENGARTTKKKFCLKLRDEHFAIKEYEKLAFLKVQGLSNIELLARMQHYGTPTRLLDVTPSFLIALYFAFENYGIQDRAIWAFNERFLYENSPVADDLRWNTLGFDDEKELSYGEILRVKSELFDAVFRLTDQCFSENLEVREAEHKPNVIPVKLIGNNSRLMAQNGAFLFPTTLFPFEENLFKCLKISRRDFKQQMTDCLDITECHSQISWNDLRIIKFVFPHNLKNSANKLFHHANISARSIYPDEIGLAKSIKYW